MKQKHEQELAMNIDYDLFTTEEIVKIFNFYSLMERTKHQNIKSETILESYRDELSVPKKINERNMYVRFVKSIENKNTKYRCDEYALTKLLTTTDMEPQDTYNISIM